MAKTEDNSNKLYGTGIGENNVIPETSGLTNIGSKITTLNPGDKYKMIDAFNIDWESGKYTYSNTNNEIIHSTGHFVEIVKQKASASELDSLRETVDSLSNRSADYFEQRWGVFDKNVTPSRPDDNDNISINVEHGTWKLTPVYENNKYTWMIARKVIYDNNNAATYSGDWSTPMRISGSDGTSYPIQPVLKYQWAASNTNAPQLTPNVNPGNAWKESPGIPTSTNIYLWMIQGQRQNGSMITWDANSDGTVGTNEYWSSPVCLSGADGQPGKDGDDLEFIYHVYDKVPSFCNDNDNPAYWAANNADKYLGPTGKEWNDNPTGVNIIDKYEYCSYRRKTGNPKAWTKFSTPFPWSIYGENGIDGDGVEYIYAVTPTDVAPTQPVITSTNYEASQQSEWGVNDSLWFDDPQEVNNENQKYQWVSTRKYRYPKSNETTLGGQTLDPNKKYWFDYSTPQLWNWYVNEGTNAPRIVMAYKRTSSNDISSLYSEGTTSITYPYNGYIWLSGAHSYDNHWCESPGNNTQDTGDEFLWMIQAYYTDVEKDISMNGGLYNKYTLEGTWSTPICLTGEPGHEGEDGSDIEFIYYRTADDNNIPTLPAGNNKYQQNDWPFIGEKNTDYYEIDGIKTLLNQDHDTWTDNPFGVTSTYDYEYAAVRRKPAGNNSQWGEFSPVFLWSKYGENGVDGDGVEYIYYLSGSNQPITFSDSDSTNNPKKWSITSTEEGKDGKKFQDNEYVGPVGSEWTDDPTGVSPGHNYEYVSVRRKKLKTGSTTEKEWGSFSEPTLWSHYGDDAVVNMITVDSDNDMMGVAIDDNGVVKQTTTSEATMSMWYQNTEIYEYTTTFISSNYNGTWTTTQSSGNTVYTSSDSKIVLTITPAKNSTPKSGAKIAITINENTTLPTGNQLHITLQLVETSSTIEGENKKMFTFNVVGLQVPQIYQLRMDKKVIRRDVNNNYADANSNNVVTLYPSVVTSDGTLITDKSNLASQDLYVFYQIEYTGAVQQESADSTQYGVEVANNASSNMYFNVQDQIITILNTTSTSYVKKVTVYLIYGDKPSNKTSHVVIGGGDDNNQENNIVMDRETIYVVSDGQAGADSKSQEYIYFLCDESEKTFTGDENPVSWSTKTNYQTDDYPFTGENGANVLGNGWTDHPQGIDETHRYEYISTRTYDTSTKKWGSFSEPVIWANWGHMGEDGDGVEYIYYLCDEENKQFDETNDPQYWTNDTGFQGSEYLRSGTSWTDNPSGVGPNNKYEYVSVRKYKNVEINTLNKLNNKDNISINYSNYYTSPGNNPFNMAPYTEFRSIENIVDWVWVQTGDYGSEQNGKHTFIGSGLYNLQDDETKAIRYAMALFINMLWSYISTSLSSYNIENAAELLHILIAVNAKRNGKTTINDILYEGVTSRYTATIGSGQNTQPRYPNFVTIINNVLSGNNVSDIENVYDELNSNGFEINDHSRNNGEQIIVNRIKINQFVLTSSKQWQPYSEPTLWAKYGENGGSGLTIDFDNPSMQIAVNSTAFIKDSQSVTTYINVYEGEQKVSAENINLSINNGPNAFKTAYDTNNKFGYIIYNGSDCTYYTWKIGDIDTNNDGEISSGESNNYYNILKLEDNTKLNFKINYNGIDYYKNVTFVPIQYGKDGEDAETFELNCSSSVIHYNKTLNTYDPSSVQYKIKHKKGNSAPDFITVDEYGQGIGDYSNFKIYYKGVTETQNSQLVTEPQTYFYGDASGDLTENESGMYSATGAAIGTTSSSTSNLYSDPNNENLTGDDVVVVTVREVTLVDDNNETLPNAQEEILNALDDSYGWTNIMNTASADTEYTMPEYDSDNIQSVINTLTDYGTYLANKGKGYATEAAEVTNVVNAISDVTSTIGTTDAETGAYTINEGYETICVVVRDEDTGAVQKEIMTKADAITIKEQDVNNKEASSASSSEGGEMSGGIRLQSRGGENPIMYAPPISSNTLSNYTLASNGIINVSNLTGNLTAIEVILVYNNGNNEIWDTDILEIVYDGVDGNDGEDAYILDWTNDQINLAVDGDGYIIGGENGQLKETSINIESLNGVFGSNPTIKLKWFNEDNDEQEEHPTNKLKKNSSDNNYVYVLDHLNNTNVTFYHSNNSENVLKIKVGAGYSGKAYISPEGIELKTHVRIYNGSTLKLNTIKILRICGQHNGENAVTYELDVTPNSLSYSSFSPNANVTINALKYNGTSVTRLSTSNDFENNNIYFTTSLYDITFTHTVGDTYNQSNSKSISKTFTGQSTYNTRYVVIKMYHYDGSTYTQIDSETIPVICDGEAGSQGFTGPIVRMRGEYDSSAHYGNGEYNKNSGDGHVYVYTDGPLYKDIVVYNNEYWTPVRCANVAENDNALSDGAAYITGVAPSSPKWEKASQFNFIATKLLYADQALINQISTHDLIATKDNGYPVAGITSGKKIDNVKSQLDPTNDNNPLPSTKPMYYNESGSSASEGSYVRIFAGEIWNRQTGSNTSYSLTYAPFNVRQDGTAYMSKANIVGDVNIGGQVNIGGNVNIEGNAKVKADVNVNTLTLNSGSFIINSDCTLPTFKEYEHKIFYVLIHHNEQNTKYYISPNTNQKLLAVQNSGFTEFSTGIEAENQGLYTAISAYVVPNFYWIISKTGIYSVPTGVQIKTQIYRDNISNYISFVGVEVAGNKALKVKFRQGSEPQCSDSSYNRIQSVTLYCNINNSLSYQVAVKTGGVEPWIYNNTSPDNILSLDESPTNLDHHYCSGSTTANGWNANNTNMNIDLWWIDPRDSKEAGDIYRIIKWNDMHGWSIDNSHNTSDAITNSSTSSMFNYYISVTFYK